MKVRQVERNPIVRTAMIFLIHFYSGPLQFKKKKYVYTESINIKMITLKNYKTHILRWYPMIRV